MSDLSGRSIKGYELHDMIGVGGFGAVYRAYQPLIKRDVALKIILPEYANHPDFIRRFEFEAQLVARLEHIHIVPLYDYWREPDGAYLIMRLLRGGSLRGRLKKSGALDNETTARVITQVASALAIAHRRGVVHRDIKPDNILFDEEGNAFLADFGIAKDLRETTVDEDQDGDQGALTGSPFYLAPEQAQSLPVSPQTDIYSLGIVIYEMLTGRPPFAGDKGLMAILRAHIHDPIPSISDLRPDLPVGVDLLIQRATAKDPDSRYDSVAELAVDLNSALGEGGFQSEAGIVISPDELDGADEDDLLVVTKPLTPSTLIIIPGAEVVNPYKGLQAFQEADAADFFGRSALIEHLLERMQDAGDISRFLAVIGPSGSGKSSVVKAGLLPALRRGALPGSNNWYLVEMVPGDDPFRELVSALLSVATHSQADLLARLEESDRGLVDVVQDIVPEGSELLLVIDQFEEVFTLVEDEARRAHFLQLLLHAIAEPASRIRIIVTLRADFYDRPLLYPGFGEMVRRRNEVVLPLSPQEMREAIVGPAEQVGITVESGLVAAIVSEVAEQPGALPLMQYALTELFERRDENVMTLEAYQATGGVLGALARRAEELFQNASPEHQAAMRQLFLRLVTIGEGTDDTRRRVTQVELMSVINDDDLVTDLLDTLGKYRLLTFDHDPETRIPTIEVAHEALIRQWERLKNWLDDNREALLLQRKLLAATNDWNANDTDTSYLASGLQLQRFEQLLAAGDLALTQAEIAYIEASVAERQRREAVELDRLRREKRQDQIIKWGSVAAAVIVGIVAILAVRQWFEAEDQREIAEDEREIAQEQRAIAERESEIAGSLELVAHTQKELGADDTDLAIALAIAANAIPNPPDEAQRILEQALFTPGTRRVYAADGDNYMMAVSYSPDGTRALSADYGGNVHLWDIASSEPLSTLLTWDDNAEDGIDGPIHFMRAVTFSPDGETFLCGDAGGLMILADAASGDIIRTFGPDDPETEDVVEGHSNDVRSIAYVGTDRAVTASDDWSLMLWDLETGEILRTFGPDDPDTEDVVEGHTERVRDVAVSPDETLIASASYDGTVKLWDVETGDMVREFIGHTAQATTVAFSPDGTQLVSGGGAGLVIRLWDVESGEELRQFHGHRGWVKSVAFSADGRTILSSSDDQSVRLWNVESGFEIQQFVGHSDFVEEAVYSPDEQYVLSASGDATLRLWDIANGSEVLRYPGHSEGVLEAEFSADGTLAASGGFDNTVRVWDVATGAERLVFEEHSDFITLIAFSPDASLIASSDAGSNEWEDPAEVETPTENNQILIWDAATGDVLHQLVGHRDRPITGMFSPDGSVFVSGSKDGTFIVWDLSTDSPTYVGGVPNQEDNLYINDLIFSPDGQLMAASRESTQVIELYDAASWELIRTLGPDDPETEDDIEGHQGAVEGIEFSPDGTLLVSGSRDNTAIVWDVASGDVLRMFDGHDSAVASAQFNPDATRVITGSWDGTINLWDAQTGELLRVLQQGPGVWAMASHPVEEWVLTGGEDATVRLWDVSVFTPDALMTWAESNRYLHELTCEERVQFRVTPLCD